MNTKLNRFSSALVIAVIAICFAGCVERGCTDPLASNYNPDAERNDGSCVYDVVTNQANIDFVNTYASIVQ